MKFRNFRTNGRFKAHTQNSLIKFESLSLSVFYVTCNDISVICVGTDVQADWRSCTNGRAPNAIDIS